MDTSNYILTIIFSQENILSVFFKYNTIYFYFDDGFEIDNLSILSYNISIILW